MRAFRPQTGTSTGTDTDIRTPALALWIIRISHWILNTHTAYIMHKRLSTNGWKYLKIAIIVIFFYRYRCVCKSATCILVHRKHCNAFAVHHSLIFKRQLNELIICYALQTIHWGYCITNLPFCEALNFIFFEYGGHHIYLSNHLIRPTLKVGWRTSTFIYVQSSSSYAG